MDLLPAKVPNGDPSLVLRLETDPIRAWAIAAILHTMINAHVQIMPGSAVKLSTARAALEKAFAEGARVHAPDLDIWVYPNDPKNEQEQQFRPPPSPNPTVPIILSPVPESTPETEDGESDEEADTATADDDDNGGGVVIIVVVVLVLVLVVVAAVIGYIVYRKRQKQLDDNQPEPTVVPNPGYRPPESPVPFRPTAYPGMAHVAAAPGTPLQASSGQSPRHHNDPQITSFTPLSVRDRDDYDVPPAARGLEDGYLHVVQDAAPQIAITSADTENAASFVMGVGDDNMLSMDL